MLEIKKRIESVLSDFKVRVFEVFYSDYEGLYEVILEEPNGARCVVYMDLSLEKIYLGQITEVETGKNKTKERIDELNSF